MKLYYLFIWSVLTFPLFTAAQDIPVDSDLLFYADIMINASDANHRARAGEKFYPMFLSALEKEGSFHTDFNDVKWITQINAQDTSFRIFSWQIDLDKKFITKGIIQLENGEVIPLLDNERLNFDCEYMELDASNWNGHIYYHMEAVPFENDSIYMLFGFDGHSEFQKQKVIDVLQFVEGRPIFGKEVFKFPSEDSRDVVKFRIKFEYSTDAVMGVNYNPSMNMIVFDHLMEVMGQIPGQGPTMVPDGTYEGFVFKDGFWEYSEKLFHEILDEAPRPKPILDGRRRDILGKKN